MSIPTIVSPSKIESELVRIWDSLQGSNKMRACLFNLILYTAKTGREGYVRAIAQKVIEKFPSRVILLTAEKDPKADYLRTGVSVLSGAKGEYDIVCDLIEIEVAGESQKRTPFLILPHILPDLPVYVLWAEDPVQEEPVAYEIEKFASRIIFDSESADDLARFAEALLHHKETSHVDIADLNWGRIESWRDLISTTFYSEERLELLERATHITITYNAQESAFFCHTRIQSIYLQAWIACQLGWKLKANQSSKEQMRFIYANKGGEVEFAIAPGSHDQLSPGTILSMHIETSAKETFAFARNARYPHQISMEVSTPVRCDIPIQFIFAKAESGQSLVKEICHKSTSAHYLRVLNYVKGLQLC